MSKDEINYTSDTIEHVKDLDHVRRRPTAYIRNLDVSGQIHMLREILDNSIDELILKPDGGCIDILIFKDNTKHTYQFVLRDSGRGIPSKSLEMVMTKIGASGKSNAGTAYNSSGGLFGYGAKVAAGLSTRFRAISQNYLEQNSSTVYLTDGVVQDSNTNTTYLPDRVGVVTIVEPDLMRFFSNGTEFVETGYIDFVNICRQLNIFNTNIIFKIYMFDYALTEKIWTSSVEEVHAIIDSCIHSSSSQIVYDTDAIGDKSEYLFSLWRVTHAVIFKDRYVKLNQDIADKLKFDIRVFFTKKSSTGNAQYFITVNNIALANKSSNSCTNSFMSVLKARLAPKIENDKHRKFFLDEYRFTTMLLAIGVAYNGAQLGGSTKDTFEDSVFEEAMCKELNAVFDTYPEEYWDSFMKSILPDIELRFSQLYDVGVKKSEDKRIFIDLNYPGNYQECKSSDYASCELYIVEGTSAGNISSTRNNVLQAVYETRGKPTNGCSDIRHIEENRRRLLKDPIYQDLMRIMSITPQTTDLSKARFGKLIIATDADNDGYHIRALHLQNLAILNPLIITSGMVWLANPPLYSMSASNKNRLFLRDKVALTDAKIQFLYEPAIVLQSVAPDGSTHTFKNELFRETCYLVSRLGEEFTTIANRLGIPLLILERLVYGVNYIYPEEHINYDKIVEVFANCDSQVPIRVQVDKINKTLIVSIASHDYIITLEAIGKNIVNHLLPIIRQYRYHELVFKVESKHKGARIRTPKVVSPMSLYLILKELDTLVDIRRYKGLGEMDSLDCFSTLMNPETRSLTNITDLGDEQMNYLLLGKDSTARKQLLTETNVLQGTFIRENL